MAGGTFLAPKKFAAISASTQTATANVTFTQSLSIADCYALGLEVTAASGTSPTLDAVVQTLAADGTTWLDLPLRYTQKTAAGAGTPEWLVFRLGLGQNEVALGQTTADTGGQLAKNCIFDPFNMRLRCTIGGTSPSFTFTLHAYQTPVVAAHS